MKVELKVAYGQDLKVLTINASDAIQARLIAESQGFSVLSARSESKSLDFRFNGRTKFNLMLFSQELLALLESGLSLIEAIEALAEKEAHSDSQAILGQVMSALYEGLPLSGSLERFPEVFPALYIALIKSSERTGDMVQALGRHVVYQSQLDAVRKKIVTASIYPVLLILVGGLVMLFLLGYVVPKFSTIYESAGTDLPWMSQVLLAWGRLLQTHGSIVFTSFISMVIFLVFIVSRQSVRALIASYILKIPAVGESMRIYQLARFYRTLGMLLRGGIPLVTAMQMVSSLLQPALKAKLQLVEKDIREGKSLSMAMESHGMTTSIAIRMLRVGERAGNIGEMMERIGIFYDDEIARVVDWFTRLLEPILMIVIGLIIGIVVVLMYMPIFELAGNIQ